ncbi:Tol biopolymer transport system component [Catenulispora sp. GAS73]|uniref:cell wall-binding repeat-containing protein n=1 Tax=Catenulispora sp. GAS73 TaxID=3156269 RepID=UPI003516F544
MAHFSLRKSLALTAVLATSVGAVLAASASANATTMGNPGSPVTVTTDGVINVVGGGTVSLPAGAHDVSWAGQAGRFAFIGADNGIYTADYNGANIIKISQGFAPSHTVWDASGLTVYWTEGSGVNARIVGVPASGSAANFPFPVDGVIQNRPADTGLSNADVAGDFNTSMVFQTTEVMNHDGISVASYNAQGQQVLTQIVAPGDLWTGGTTPTISPDGRTVVFVRDDATNSKQLFASTLSNGAWSAPKQITWGPGDHTAPIFEGDNATVAFEAAGATFQITVAAGLASTQANPTPETKISDLSGGLAVRTDSPAFVHRLGGFDRFATAVQVSRQQFRTAGDGSDQRSQAQAVVLSRSDEFADALGGSALAAHKNAPLLLTETASLNAASRGEIQRVLPAGGTVYVLGGEQAISPNVANQLAGLGYHVQRIGGHDRFETAVDMANVYAPNATQVLTATGMNFPDALSAGAVAAQANGMAVLLTDDTTMPAVTEGYLASRINGHTLTYLAAVGGQADKALAGDGFGGYDKLGGADRYATSYNVASHLFSGFSAVGIATGTDWPDSLSGGALMGRYGGPLVLVDPTYGINPVEYTLFDANRGSDNYGYVFGGDLALPSRIDDQLASAIDTATGSSHLAAGGVAKLSTPNLTTK